MTCIGCGAEVPGIEYPAHTNMRTSPGCWSFFCELLDREFSNPEYWPAHQLTVHAYALQHAANNPALHLLALSLRFDHGFSDERILPVMRRASKEKEGLPSVEAPGLPNTVTVVDVCKAAGACCPPKRVIKADYSEDTALFQALADEHRLAIVASLAQADGEICVCDFTDRLPLNQPTVSHHLRILRESGLVTSERRGTWVYYSLAPDAKRRLQQSLRSIFDGKVLA